METIVQLLLPFIMGYMLIFFLIFDCILNFFAELTRFADRHFYDDWWNSKNWDEFARRWNKPVHHFLLRYVYWESRRTYRLSKGRATFLVFLFSSLLHELVLAVAARRIRFYLFALQMGQLPMIWGMQQRFVRDRPWLGNMLFWIGLIIGTPLLSVLYCREYYLYERELEWLYE